MVRSEPRHALSLAVLALIGGSGLSLAHDGLKPSGPSLGGPSYAAGAWGSGEGTADGTTFESFNTTLLARLTNAEVGSTKTIDCWGYTSPSGREYAIWCHSAGTHFVEVTDPTEPTIVGSASGGMNVGWRDAKVYQDHAYIVSESGGGIQVVDLSAIDDGVVTHLGNFTSGPGGGDTHNVAIDMTSGYLYRCGGSSLDGLRIYSLANPSNPVYVGSWSDRYVHDVQVITYESGPYAGREIAFCCSGFTGGWIDTGVSIVDVTNKANPVHRGQVSWPDAAYSHQAWLSDDLQTLYVNDESDEGPGTPTTIYEIDFSDIDNPAYAGSFTNGNTATGHNLYVNGDTLYAANYRSGLRVFDLAGPGDPTEVAWFDSYPSSDSAGFFGAWSTYPFFDSGVVVVTDTAGGLFLLWVGPEPVQFAFPGGNPLFVDAEDATLGFSITESEPGALVPGSAKLFVDAGEGFVEAPLTDLGDGSFEAALGGLPCGGKIAYYVSAESSTGLTWIDPPNGETYGATVTAATSFAFQDAFDADLGWTSGAADDDATQGAWERGAPVGTIAQPADDFTATGLGLCWFTGQHAGGAAAQSDVDGGKTTLTSPPIDLSAPGDYYASFRRWYSNDLGANPGEDALIVEASSDGVTWVSVDVVGPTGPKVAAEWQPYQFRVQDYVALSSTFQVRFVASDDGGESLIEAAIDDFAVLLGPCVDCNKDGEPDDLQLQSGALTNNDADDVPDACEGLSVDATFLSAGAGGTVEFALTGPSSEAGRLYLLLGSLIGTTPGFNVGAVHVPLNQDVYFNYTLTHASSPPLVNSFGLLDANAEATASFVLVPGYTNLAGLQANHAWMAIDPFTLGVTYASHALPLDFEL